MEESSQKEVKKKPLGVSRLGGKARYQGVPVKSLIIWVFLPLDYKKKSK